MLSTTNNLLIDNDELDFNVLDFIKSKPELKESQWKDIGYITWNDIDLYLTKDYRFFNFDELCRTIKSRKIKTWDNSTTWTSCFKTHFENTGLTKHKDRFKTLHGDQYVHVMYLCEAAKAVLNTGEGTRWFHGEEDWCDTCGVGWIYYIYIVGLKAWKFGKAEKFRLENRLTLYISQLPPELRKLGIKIMGKLMVKNMSKAEDEIRTSWLKEGYEIKENTREYFVIPESEGSLSLRTDEAFDIMLGTLQDNELDVDWDNDDNYQYWGFDNAQMRYPKK